MADAGVALALLTCERHDYTARTLETLAAHNDLAAFTLLHGDDASADPRIVPLAQRYGFETVARPGERQGVMAMERALAKAAQARGCRWTWLLQNDWESVRPFPWPLFEFVAAEPLVYCLRLYGHQKDRGARVAGSAHQGKDGADAGWRRLSGAPEPVEVGSIHWGSPPAVTRTDLLRWLLKDAAKDRDARLKSGRLDYMTARVVENVVYHIGEEKTPGFLS